MKHAIDILQRELEVQQNNHGVAISEQRMDDATNHENNIFDLTEALAAVNAAVALAQEACDSPGVLTVAVGLDDIDFLAAKLRAAEFPEVPYRPDDYEWMAKEAERARKGAFRDILRRLEYLFEAANKEHARENKP